MSFIDYTYFTGKLNIPFNANDATDPLYTALIDAIDRYENEILKKLLGYTLWKEFTDAVTASELDVGDPNYAALPSKWVDFKDGAAFEFTYSGQTISTKWNGLLNSDKISLIANYIYCNLRVNTETFYTGLGERKAKGENSIMADPKPKIIEVWNEMIGLYGKTPYPLVKDKDYFLDTGNYTHENALPSAFNFLLANISDYDNWVFIPLRLKHSHW